MTFEDPVWLYITPLVALIIAGLLAYGMQRRETLLARFAASRLLEQLTERADLKRSMIKSALVVLGIVAITASLARPQYGVEWSERKARGLDIVFVLDSSKSMLATDLRPNRLARAKLAILDLVERLESDRIGLVAFAGQAFLQTPPTLDYTAFRESLESVDPQVMTRGGSDLGRALQEAAKAFPVENNYKAVVLLTDGEDLRGGALQALQQASDNAIKVYAIGIGTPEGEYLKVQNDQGEEEFVRDQDGQPVRSQLDETTLQEIAQLTGGTYSRLSSESLDALYHSVISTLPRSERESEMQEVRIERFQWLLSAACFFLVVDILIRRRKITQTINVLIFIVGAGLLASSNLQAQDPAINADSTEEALPLDLPETAEALTEPVAPQPKSATELYNEAHRYIEDQSFEMAQQHYEAAMRTPGAGLKIQQDAVYNLAHCTYQLGESAFQQQDFETTIELWKQAEARFRAAHEINPQDQQALTDAELVEARRKALEDFLKQQDPQQDQQEQSDDSQEQDESGESGDEGQQQENSESNESGESGEEQQESGGSQESEESSEQSEQSESGESGESEQQDADGSETDDSEQGDEESQQPTPSSEDETNSTEESQPLPEQGDEADDESAQAPTGQAGEPSEGEDEGAATGGSPAAVQSFEGMTEQEARELLDTLMNQERLLPFIEEGEPRPQSMQDW